MGVFINQCFYPECDYFYEVVYLYVTTCADDYQSALTCPSACGQGRISVPEEDGTLDDGGDDDTSRFEPPNFDIDVLGSFPGGRGRAGP